MGWGRGEGASVSDENQKTLPKMDDFCHFYFIFYIFLFSFYFIFSGGGLIGVSWGEKKIIEVVHL